MHAREQRAQRFLPLCRRAHRSRITVAISRRRPSRPGATATTQPPVTVAEDRPARRSSLSTAAKSPAQVSVSAKRFCLASRW